MTPVSKKGCRFLFWSCWLFISLMMASPLVGFFRFGTFTFESGEFKSDRYLILSISKATQDLGFNFLDPVSRQGNVFYQFVPYWALGFLARFFSLDPWAMANIVQLLYAPLFFVLFYLIGKVLLDDPWGALMGTCLTFLFGNLEILLTGTSDFTTYGLFGCIFDFSRQISTFSGDALGLMLGYLAFFFFLKLALAEPGAANRKWVCLFLITAGIAFAFHWLTGLFFLTMCFALLAGVALGNGKMPLGLTLKMAVGTGAVYFLVLLFTHWHVPTSVIFLFGLGVVLFFFWFSPQKLLYVLLGLSLAPLAIYLLVNYLIVRREGSDPNFMHFVTRSVDLAIPLHVYFVAFFPLLVGVFTYWYLCPSGLSRWFCVTLIVGILALVFNHFLGYNNHPYRFIPYSVPLLCLFTAQGLRFLWVEASKQWLVNLPGLFMIGIIGLLLVGSIKNLYFFYYHLLPRLHERVPPGMVQVAQKIEELRTGEPDAVFFVVADHFTMSRLTPFTSAKFFDQSPFQPYDPEIERRERVLWGRSLSDIPQIIKDNFPKVNYLLTYFFDDFKIIPLQAAPGKMLGNPD